MPKPQAPASCPMSDRRPAPALLLALTVLVAGAKAAPPPEPEITLPQAPQAESAASLDDILARALAAERAFDVAEALRLYRQADALRPDDPAILQKIARQLSDLELAASDPAEKKRLATEALARARRAAELAPLDPVNLLSIAICHGKLAAHENTRGKIERSRLVRAYAERALALDPAYDWAHHVLGRWHHEVAALGAASRLFVRVVHGGLPEASRAEAVRQLEEAVRLAPDRVPHHVELGFALLASGRSTEARASFERALALPSVELYDEPAKARARAALPEPSTPSS